MPQSLASVLVHLVFSTKHREPFIQESVEPELYPYLATVFKGCKSPLLTIGGTHDHIHCLFSLSRTIAIADVVEEIKKRSSRWIKDQGRQYRAFAWQEGYGAFSVSKSQVKDVQRYIGNQKKRHARRGFQDEFRKLLLKHEVDFDERYIWD
jgi:REP-associated tyrosine transposase